MRTTTLWLAGTILAGILTTACSDDESPATGATDTQTTSDQGGAGGTTTTTTTTTATGGAGGQGAAGGGGAGGEGGAPEVEWQAPACAVVSGTSAITFTTDEGATLTPTAQPLTGVGYALGLAALDTPNTLLAEYKGDLLQSTDAGCVWSKIGSLVGGYMFHITAAPGGRAYAWEENGPALYRIDGGVATLLTSPASNIVGLGVDPSDGLHLRIGDGSGALSDSVDGGVNWTKQGQAGEGANFIGYRFAFDPADLDHILFGQTTVGARLSIDGGATWVTSTGLGASANAFSLVVSPVDGNIVWAEAIELGPDVRHVLRSGDGGATFEVVATDSAEVILVNGSLLVPHATDPDILYFVFGSHFQNYGTDIFRYDHVAGKVTKTHNTYDDVFSIVPSPADPSVLYFGLAVEQI